MARAWKGLSGAALMCLLGVAYFQVGAWGGEGVERCAIVVGANADPAIAEAAADLKEYLGRAGIEAEVVAGSGGGEGRRILLGADAAGVGEGDLPVVEAGIEACRMRERGGAIVIAGRDPIATANGVYTFLMKRLGVRWFVPGPMGEYVPSGKRGEVFEGVGDEVIAPVFAPRDWKGFWMPGRAEASWVTWMRRNRMMSPAASPYASGNAKESYNSWQHPFWQKFKDDESMYPLVDGKRMVVDFFRKLKPNERRCIFAPCWSRPEAAATLIDVANKFFDDNPEAGAMPFGLDDVDIYCECDACRALDGDAPVGFTSPIPDVSNRWYWLVNEVAKGVAKAHPDKYLKTLIYKNVRAAPTTIGKLEPNVIGVLAASTASGAEWRVAAIREKEMAESAAWSRVCSHLGRWEYLGLAELVPRYYPHLTDEQIRFDAGHGITIVDDQTPCVFPNVAPMYWCAQQLYWEPDAPIDGLLAEFFAGVFAEAAKPMGEYFEYLEALWVRPERGFFSGYGGVMTTAQFMDAEQIERGEALLAGAREAATSEASRERIEVFARAFEYGALICRTYQRALAVERLPVNSSGNAEKALSAAVEASGFCRERDERWKEIENGEDLTGESLRALRLIGSNITIKRLGELDRPIEDAFVRAAVYLARNAPGELGEAAKAASEGEGRSRLGGIAREIAEAGEPAARALDGAFWKERLGREVELSEGVSDRLGIEDLADREGLQELFDWGSPGGTKVTPRDFPALAAEEDQAAIEVGRAEGGGQAYAARLTIPGKVPSAWQWPAVTLTDLAVRDWRGFAGLAVGFHNPTEQSEEAGLCVRSADKRSWETTIVLSPDESRIVSVPTEEMGRRIAVEDILAVTIWTRRPTQRQVFLVTPIYLVLRSRCKKADLIEKATGGNGGFERGSLEGWRAEVKGKGEVEIVTEGAAEGRCAARVRGEGSEDLAVLSAVVEKKDGLDARRVYRLSFAAKPLAGRCRIVVAGGPTTNATRWLHTTPEWKRYEITVGFVHPDGEGPGKGTDMPLNFQHLSFQFYGGRPFELLVDDVKLEGN
ncbi:MAG: DUF4838 domain-containing protein [Planctomycetota bacterium]